MEAPTQDANAEDEVVPKAGRPSYEGSPPKATATGLRDVASETRTHKIDNNRLNTDTTNRSSHARVPPSTLRRRSRKYPHQINSLSTALRDTGLTICPQDTALIIYMVQFETILLII